MIKPIMVASLIVLSPLNPPPEVPPVGTEVERSFEIPLPASVEGPSITVAADGAAIVISRELLETIVSEDGATWNSEEERQARIAAARAKKLLAMAAPVGGAMGSAEPLKAGALGDAIYLIVAILEAGKAVVVPAGSGKPARVIVVRYSGTHPEPMLGFGRITFSLQKPPRTFLSVSWFVA